MLILISFCFKFCKFIFLNLIETKELSLCLPTLQRIPIAPINTLKDVPPADTNGIGIPVGGIEPVNISCCIIKIAILFILIIF